MAFRTCTYLAIINKGSYLVDGVLSLFLVHLGNVYDLQKTCLNSRWNQKRRSLILKWLGYLHDIGLPVDHRLDEDGVAEGALPDDLKLPVLFHIKFK